MSAPLTSAMRAALIAAAERRGDGIEYRDGTATMGALLDCEDAGLLTPTRVPSERWRITAAGLEALRAEVSA